MRHPVVEIGDDGLHLLVVDATQDHRLEPLICEERPLRIGAAIKRSGSLDDGTADLVVETARRLARRAHDVAVAPLHTFLTGMVATTADDALLDRIATATGVAPRRLHPEEDTRLAFLAAMVGASDPHTPAVVLRLGWRHVQLALGRDGQVLWATEAELGIDDLVRSLEIEDGLTKERSRRSRGSFGNVYGPSQLPFTTDRRAGRWSPSERRYVTSPQPSPPPDSETYRRGSTGPR